MPQYEISGLAFSGNRGRHDSGCHQVTSSSSNSTDGAGTLPVTGITSKDPGVLGRVHQ